METNKRSEKNKALKIYALTAAVMLCVGVLIVFIIMWINGYKIERVFPKTEYTTHEEEFIISDSANVAFNLDVDDVKIQCADVEKAKITYNDFSAETHQFSVTENEINLTADIEEPGWFENLFIDFSDADVVLTLPKSYNGKITINSKIGDTSIKSIVAEEIYIKQTTGHITLENIDCPNIKLETTTGDTAIKDSVAQELSIKQTTGHVTLKAVNCQRIKAETTTGDIYIKNEGFVGEKLELTAKTGHIRLNGVSYDRVTATTTTGDIILDRVMGNSLVFSATTGECSGSIIGTESDYSIETQTATGDCSPASRTGGSKQLMATTTTGDIDIDFVD